MLVVVSLVCYLKVSKVTNQAVISAGSTVFMYTVGVAILIC